MPELVSIFWGKGVQTLYSYFTAAIALLQCFLQNVEVASHY